MQEAAFSPDRFSLNDRISIYETIKVSHLFLKCPAPPQQDKYGYTWGRAGSELPTWAPAVQCPESILQPSQLVQQKTDAWPTTTW